MALSGAADDQEPIMRSRARKWIVGRVEMG